MRSKAVAFWLCLFFGVLGLHRFYMGKPFSGLLWFFTGGLLGIGFLSDLWLIGLGLARDGRGLPLLPPGRLHDGIIRTLVILSVIWIFISCFFVLHNILFQPEVPLFDRDRLPLPPVVYI